MKPVLFPAPAKVEFSNRKPRSFEACRWILVDTEFSPLLRRHARDLVVRFSGLFAKGLEVTAGFPAAGRVFLRIVAAEEGHPQGYRLTVGADGVLVEAAGEPGAYYGLQTLTQMLDQCGAALPEGRIEDQPDFWSRGVMLDVARCKVPTMESLRGMLDTLASMKINQVQLYMEHTFAFSAHEIVWADASPFTAAEVQQVDDWCRERYIELAPNFNSFGHFAQWLRHPEYKHLAECPDGFSYPWGGSTTHGSVLKPNAATLALLESLYDEFLPNFSSGLFNVGCDETWELGLGWSKPLCDKRGKTRVYLDFLLEIHKRVTARGRRMMFWGDIILHQPELVKELPKDIIALDWGYEADHPYAKQAAIFAKSGVPFYVCPGTSSWGSIVGRTTNMLANLENAAINGLKHGSCGFLNTDWGDNGHHQTLPVAWPGYAAGAAYSWNLAANRKADIAEALNRLVYRDTAGVLGQVNLEMGRVMDRVPVHIGNGSMFDRMLFWDLKEPMKVLEPLRPAMLKACVARFDELEAQLGAAKPAAPEGALWMAEFRQAIGLARHASRRGLAWFHPKDDRGPLRRELMTLIRQHEAQWLARNRVGGLHESSGRLRASLAPLQ